jgi:hypothetical protein
MYGCLFLSAVVFTAACARDGDLLSYRLAQPQPASSDLGVLVEVTAARRGGEERSVRISVEQGSLSIEGTQIDAASTCESLGGSDEVRDELADNLDGPPLRRWLLTIVPMEQESILHLGLHEGVACEGRPLDAIVVPIQRPSEGNQAGDAGVVNADA